MYVSFFFFPKRTTLLIRSYVELEGTALFSHLILALPHLLLSDKLFDLRSLDSSLLSLG